MIVRDELNEISFLGMDIIKETEKIINDSESRCDKSKISELELKNFKAGILFTLDTLRCLLKSNDKDYIVHIPEQNIIEEFDIDDLYIRSVHAEII